MSPRCIAQKIYDAHTIGAPVAGEDLLYIDFHLIHEVTTPQAFDGLRAAGRRVRRPRQTLATMDHSIPTFDPSLPVIDPVARRQLELLERNCREFGIQLLGRRHPNRGIVHMIGPELGITQPGMTIVCGDSHTSTHGALGALAFGIGTTEVEHVLATQTLPQRRPRFVAIDVHGLPDASVTAKDLILNIIATIGVRGGLGAVLEYRGDAIRALSIEGRMTVCNMSIEAGARAGLIEPDDVTFSYLQGRPFAPRGDAWNSAVAAWRELCSDEGAKYDDVIDIDAASMKPMVTWGTTPAMSVPVDGRVPTPNETADAEQTQRALDYMGLRGGERLSDLRIDRVFIGSCTNGRIEDLRRAARVVDGKRVAPGVRAMVVPGSTAVKRAAEEEGLADIFRAAGFEWREAGCSMCVAMNGDIAAEGERCVSTSNRNFEGRQGKGARTHLASPEIAAAAALRGRIVDPREL